MRFASWQLLTKKTRVRANRHSRSSSGPVSWLDCRFQDGREAVLFSALPRDWRSAEHIVDHVGDGWVMDGWVDGWIDGWIGDEWEDV